MYDTLERGKWYTKKGGGFYNFIGREIKSGNYNFHTINSVGEWGIYRVGGLTSLDEFIVLEDKTELNKAIGQSNAIAHFRSNSYNDLVIEGVRNFMINRRDTSEPEDESPSQVENVIRD